MMGASTAVSVVIPARNAAATLEETLDSLSGQTMRDWMAIIVDDASTDDTGRIAADYATRDQRFKVVTCTGTGEGAARNTGLDHAVGEWVLFLDADDLIEPNALEVLSEAVHRDSSLDLVMGESVRIAPDGCVMDTQWYDWDPHHDIFEALSMYCPFTIHACLVRRSIVDAVGRFDTDLRAAADWDLWQRVIRAGAKLGQVGQVVARYRMRSGAAASNARNVFEGGRRVIARGHAADPRVTRPVAAYAEGWPPAHEYAALLRHVVWVAGLAIGAGEDWSPYLSEAESARSSIEGRVAVTDDEEPDGSSIDRALRFRLDPATVAYGLREAALLGRCLQSHDWARVWPDVADPMRRFLGRLEGIAGVPDLAWRTELLLQPRTTGPAPPVSRGRFYVIDVEITEAIPDVLASPDNDRLLCVALLEDAPVGLVDLPICDGTVPAEVLADALSARWYWPLLLRFVERRGRASRFAPQDARWDALMTEIWDEAEQEPNPTTASCVDGLPAFEISAAPPEIVTTGEYVDIVCLVGGKAVDVVRLAYGGRPSGVALRRAVLRALGGELLAAIAREGLVGRRLTGSSSLRAVLADRAASGDGEPNSRRRGLTIGRRATGAAGTSTSRYAVFPAACTNELERSAALAGEPAITMSGEAGAAYDPSVLWTGPVTASQTATPRKERRNLRFWSRRRTSTEWLPILRYRRSRDAGADALGAASFTEQLDFLRTAGFRSISLGRWEEATRFKEPVDGRAVVIAIEATTREFETVAWPVLRRFGFGATVLLDVGDDPSGAGALAEAGSEFGSQFASAKPLTAASASDIVGEAAAARSRLTAELGRPPTCFSYPFGHVDDAVLHLIGACGYLYGLTNVYGRAGLQGDLMRLPTIAVRTSDSLDEFARKVAV